MTISQKKAAADVEDKLKDLSFEDQSEESEVECPKCGLLYGEDSSVWIQCDECS